MRHVRGLWPEQDGPGTPLVRWTLLFAVEGIILITYFAVTTASVSQYRYVLYPFVWINVSLWVAARVRPPETTRRRMVVGVVIAGGYLLVISILSGIVSLTATTGTPGGIGVSWVVPGWGPLVTYDGGVFDFALVPFEVIGYTILSYLVYVAAIGAMHTALSGTIGLASCVSCATPVLTTLVGGASGIQSSTISAAYRWSYDIGTVLFVVAVGLLFWSHKRSVGSG